jgi:hypothetical protein
MGLFDPASILANQMKAQTAQQFQQLASVVQQKIKAFWNNPNLTPQQIATALGTDGAAEVAALNATITLLNTLQPGMITFTPPQAITVNADGTITLAPAS